MHVSKIPPSVLARTSQMLEGEVIIDPARTAHLVVDLQNGFVEPGAFAEVTEARTLMPNVNRISAAVRRAGGLNIFIRFLVDLEEPLYWRSFYGRMQPHILDAFSSAFRRGAPGHALSPELEVTAADLLVDKTRFSAFTPGTCDLQEILSSRGIEVLIVTGTMTNCCCESTVRDAMQLGYGVLFAQDGAAAHDDDTHNATLANLAGLGFAEVLDTEAIVARLDAACGSAHRGGRSRTRC